MVFGFGKKDLKKLEERLEGQLEEKLKVKLGDMTLPMVDIFTSAKSDLIADNTLTIARCIEEAKKELGKNVNDKIKNALYEKTKEYEVNLKKITDDYMKNLKEHADSYFSAVLTQYEIVIDNTKNTSQEFKALAEKAKQSFQDLEMQIELLTKASKAEEVEKVLNYKKEIDLRLQEAMVFYEAKDKQYMAVAKSFEEVKETIEKESLALQERLVKQIDNLNKLIEGRKAKV